MTLLDRTSRRVELTAAGSALQSEGRHLLTQAQHAVRATQAAGSDRLTVGFYGSAAAALLPKVLRRFSERRPAAAITIRELLLGGVDDITTGDVDIAFTRLLPGQLDLELEVLACEPRLVALAGDHRLAGRDSLLFADLREESFITNRVVPSPGPPIRWLAEQQRQGLPGRVAAEAASVHEILALVAAGRGVCLVPASVALHYRRPDVAYVEVSDAEPAVVSLAWRQESMRPIIEEFIDAAREAAVLIANGSRSR
ncbi:MAG: LysR family substrate-binding domain-containing protein [Solirubrobacterales bacterium]|nr:LysR family substrate-binding domain-containing protein [Solirubrobacterales bacterium]